MNDKNIIGSHIVQGLDFSPEVVDQARKNDSMLVLDIDFTRKCKLRCFYCDRTPDRLISNSEKRDLTSQERKNIIRQAKDIGAWAVGIVGAGEPMLDPDFWELLGFINSLGLIPLVYASGTEIESPETVKKLWDMNASIMLKYNSVDEKIADEMTGVKGYGKHVKQVLEWLLEYGFNKTIPPRIGINVVATNIIRDEKTFLDLFRWCRKNNVYMHGQPLIPEGNANNELVNLSRDEALTLLHHAAEIDREEFGILYKVIPPIVGGFRCRKVNVGMFVNVFGEVWDCNGSGRKLGDIRQNSLAEIWHSPKARKVREPIQEGFCLIRERWWKRVGDQNTNDRTIQQ